MCGCGERWPCLTRRAQLIAEFSRTAVSLGLLMSGYFIDAAQVLESESAHTFHQRFMGWLR
jgi:hypothetical protein